MKSSSTCLCMVLMAMAAVSVVVVDAGRHHGGGGGFGGGEPTFLNGVNSTGRSQFFRITRNRNLTIADKDQQLAQWATQYGVSTQFQEYQQNVTAHQTQLSQSVATVLSRLSEAKTAVDGVFANKAQTLSQQHAAVQQIANQYPVEVPVLFFIGKEIERNEFRQQFNSTGRRNRH